MNSSGPRKAANHVIYASILIALSSLSTGATGQSIYRCGNNYSQTPCPGAQTIQVDDTRDAKQKKQTDEAVRLDAKQALALETRRIALEKAALKQAPAVTPNTEAATPKPPQVDEAGVVHKITPKQITPKHSKPDGFEAQVPGSEQKSGDKKSKKKKPTQKVASSPA
jgi:hypothetical protein